MSGIDETPGEAPKALERGRFAFLFEEMREGWLGTALLLLGAALLGAFAAVAALNSGLIGDFGSDEANARLGAVENRLAALESTETGGDLPGRIAALSDRVRALEEAPGGYSAEDFSGLASRVAELEARAANADEDLKTQGPIADQLAALKERINALAASLPPAGLAAQLEEALKRIGILEAQDIAGHTKRAATALAISNLARATLGSAPFVQELNALSTIAPGTPEIAELKPYAEKGLPTLETLRSQFGALIVPALRAEEAADDQDWLDRLWSNIVSLVSVRATGEVKGTSSEAILARAEVRLGQGDLAAALAELNALSSAARETLAPWLAEAEARHKLDRLVSAATARLIAEMAQSPKAP